MNTSINIMDISGHYFKYLINYTQITDDFKNQYEINCNNNCVHLYNSNDIIRYERFGNSWSVTKNNNFMSDFVPRDCKLSEVKLCIPLFSVNSYENGVQYALTINTWIRDVEINLGTFIFDNSDFMALSRPIVFGDNNYYEQYHLIIPDPMYILYSKEWKKFREIYCGINKIKDEVVNTTGSIINFSLYPVEKMSDVYHKLNNYLGGQNSINITHNKSNFLNLNISHNLQNILEEPSIICELEFNNFYNNDLKSYLRETYNIREAKLHYNLAIGNSELIWGEIKSPLLDITLQNLKYKFNKTDITHCLYDKKLSIQWEPGLKIVGSIDVMDENEETVLYLLSNEIMLDIEKYKYFKYQNGECSEALLNLKNVNLQNVDMNIYEINAVNKILNKIINIENSEDVKSNIIQPIFFKSYPVPNIIVHNNITENISMNLDIYKSRVSVFLLKIGDSIFKEIGRTPAGVLFKIKGQLLKNIGSGGTFFILNENEEMVTSGKYTVEA